MFESQALRRIAAPCPDFRIAYDTLLVRLLRMTSSLRYIDTPLYHRTVRSGSLTTAARTGMGSRERARVHRSLAEIDHAAWQLYRRYVQGRLARTDLWEAIRTLNERSGNRNAPDELHHHVDRLRSQLRNGKVPLNHQASPDWHRRGRRIVDRLRFNEWTVAPETALELVERLATRRPASVVEAGSGASTVLFGEYARVCGARVTSLEHRPESFKATQRLLEKHGLLEHVDLRLSTIEEHRDAVAGTRHPWYARAVGLPADVAFVDGPPMRVGRAGALFALQASEVWLHDATRGHETTCVDLWRAYFEFEEELSSVGKGVRYISRICRRAPRVAE